MMTHADDWHGAYERATDRAALYAAAAEGWREMAVEGIHALASMQRRVQQLEAQCAALRAELRQQPLTQGDEYES